jgi:nitrogen regulatory protein PII
MKMLMAIVDSNRKEEFEIVLRNQGIKGYTEIPEVNGFGSTGMRMSSLVHPGSSAIIYALLEENELTSVVDKIKEFCAECSQHLKLMHWDVQVEM